MRAARAEWRTRLRRWRDELPPEAVAAASTAVAARVMDLPAWRDARRLLAYWSIGSEVATPGLIRSALDQGKQVYLPHVLPAEKLIIPRLITDPAADLRPGPYGIPEPDPRRCPAMATGDRPDLVLVPGLAFDRAGNRLGYGQGYFDRYLAGLPATVVSAGLAFAGQVADVLPAEPWDVPVHLVVTEEEVIDCSPSIKLD